MSNNLNTHGWATPSPMLMERYINKCKIFLESDEQFSKFRQDPDYKIILEGWNEGGNVWLGEILSSYGDEALLERLELFKRNDIYGGPTIINYPIVGKMCPFTLKYILDAFRILENFRNAECKKIIEVGVGFGSMCIVMDSIHDFEEYILVDLPEVIELTKKYLSHFPEIYSKVKFVPCDDLENFNLHEEFDLFISDAALAECNLETQFLYIDKFASKSKLGYINYNSAGCEIGSKNYRELMNKISKIFEVKEIEAGVKYLYLKKK